MSRSTISTFQTLLLLTIVLLALIGCAGEASGQCTAFTVSHKRIIVPVMVNGQGPYPFLLDTGATVTVLDKSLAKDMKMKGYISVNGIGAKKWVEATTLETVGVGSYTDHKLDIMVYDLQIVEQMVDSKILGILGNYVFMDMGLVNLNYKTMCLEVR